MPQVFNTNSFWKTCFINNFHEIPSNHSFPMCHNELIFSSYKYQGLGDENNEHTAMGRIIFYVALINLKCY